MLTEAIRIKNAYKTIGDFFDAFDLPDAGDYIQTSLLAANSKKLWKQHCPADLLFFYGAYKKLFNAAATISKDGCQRRAAILSVKENSPTQGIINTGIYCKPLGTQPYWLYIPMHLSVKEFCNPYKAIRKAVRFMQQDIYDELFDGIVQYALCYDSFADAGLNWDTLQLNIMLQKLAEAAWLLHVRTCANENS